MRWDDLQFVLAVQRAGGLAGAARSLGVDYTTAHRKLRRVESSLGVRVFDRRADGYRVSPAASGVIETALKVEAEVAALERRIVAGDAKLSGTIRVSTTDLLGLYVLPPMLEVFRRQFPGVEIQLSLTDTLKNLSRSDVDVVIRTTARPPPALSGHNVGPVRYAAYIRKDRAVGVTSLDDFEWLAYVAADPDAPMSRWLRQRVPDSTCRYRSDSAASILESLSAGLGAAILPTLAGDRRPELERISDVWADKGFDYWILTHVELRRTARIRSFMRFFEDEMRTLLKESSKNEG